MTPTLVRQHRPHSGPHPRVDPRARARDWSEIQERMLVPLYEAVYERLDVGPATRLLGLGCGSGLALLMARSRGAAITGTDPSSPERLALARERLLPADPGAPAPGLARIVEYTGLAAGADETPRYTLVTAFEPVGCVEGDAEVLGELLAPTTRMADRGAAVVLTGWGPPERCATSTVLRSLLGPADPARCAGGWRGARRDDLEDIARRAGLRADGSGRVTCVFGYADLDSAVRGLMSTGLFDAAVGDREQVDKELSEALHPYRRPDGTVWMPNVFRYLIARVP
ncbi:SAM-dependent methyltransferase [Streptomyces sp. NPDC005017]|uniref:SAM-dependent methyltransferase n=1 Tax=Streptomyces sp. NPDC005017 TaxID=3364706 RepID=UPI00367FB4F7